MTLTRVQKLQQLTAVAGLDSIAVVPGPNMVYFTGLTFHLSERPTVAFFPVDGIPVLIVPKLEEGKAHRTPYEVQVFTYSDEQSPLDAFNRALQVLDLGGKKLGVEGRRIRFLELDLMAASNQAPQAANADPLIAKLRMRKDHTELAAMRRAVAIAQQALEAMLPVVKPGVTEKELAAELTLQLLRCGSEGELPFAPLVAAGPNAADPHGFPSNRPVEPGDILIFDWGATANSYFSDITRTFAIAGAPLDPQLRRAYEAVQAANQAGKVAAKPGATGQDVDRATRAVIEEAGFGPYFVHRTGHGLGVEIHEEPDMKEGSLVPLEPGTTFTVEPGVYLPGVGGIRIEDDVVITQTGSESLTTLPRALTALG